MWGFMPRRITAGSLCQEFLHFVGDVDVSPYQGEAPRSLANVETQVACSSLCHKEIIISFNPALRLLAAD